MLLNHDVLQGFEMLKKMGWKKEVLSAVAGSGAALCSPSLSLQDGGLGASVRGLAEPIPVNIKRTREGLGCVSETPIPAASASSGTSSEATLQDFRSSSTAWFSLLAYLCLHTHRLFDG